MRIRFLVAFLALILCSTVFPQTRQQRTLEQPIRISTELIQLDVVVTDKNGQVVRGLTKDDFTLVDEGKKQQVSFFEFVDLEAPLAATNPAPTSATAPLEGADLAGAGIRRIVAFVVDDLTINYEDLAYIRQMLTNFVDNKMRPADLTAVVRTVGGKGLLQQFTTDKNLLHRAIAALTPQTHPFSAFNNPAAPRISGTPNPLIGDPQSPEQQVAVVHGDASEAAIGVVDTSGEVLDISNPQDDTHKALRTLMSLGTAGFVIDSMKELPGRKSLVLISGGLPILNSKTGANTGTVQYLLNSLTDKATRAGVSIDTMDVRGLQAMSSVASFTDTPGKSMVTGSTGDILSGRSSNMEASDPYAGGRYMRGADETLLNTKNPFDAMEAQMGLRTLASATGGIAVLNRNDFDAGLDKILASTEGYYLLAYVPSDTKFDGSFRKVEVKVRGDYKVYNRRGYIAKEDKPSAAPATKQEQMLAAVKSPLARRDIDFDTMLLYKAAPSDQGAIDMNLVIDPRKLKFEEVGGKLQASCDVAGFVFDELGKMRGGFSETLLPSFTREEYDRALETGISYLANTTLPAGIYQIRLAVRDNKSGHIGVTSRYVELPEISKGKLTASSLLVGAVPQKDVTATSPTPITASRRISRAKDLRYAVIVYNAKLKDGKPQVKTQLSISQNGNVIFKEPEEMFNASNPSMVLKVGQLGLAGVKPGRYTLTLEITDTLADKKSQTVSRSMDFVVVN
jgi:VWFA-related protein